MELNHPNAIWRAWPSNPYKKAKLAVEKEDPRDAKLREQHEEIGELRNLIAEFEGEATERATLERTVAENEAWDKAGDIAALRQRTEAALQEAAKQREEAQAARDQVHKLLIERKAAEITASPAVADTSPAASTPGPWHVAPRVAAVGRAEPMSSPPPEPHNLAADLAAARERCVALQSENAAQQVKIGELEAELAAQRGEAPPDPAVIRVDCTGVARKPRPPASEPDTTVVLRFHSRDLDREDARQFPGLNAAQSWLFDYVRDQWSDDAEPMPQHPLQMLRAHCAKIDFWWSIEFLETGKVFDSSNLEAETARAAPAPPRSRRLPGPGR